MLLVRPRKHVFWRADNCSRAVLIIKLPFNGARVARAAGSLPPEDQMQRLLASLPPETRNVVEAAMKGNISGGSGGGASKVLIRSSTAVLIREYTICSMVLAEYSLCAVSKPPMHHLCVQVLART